ncbi:uncharacterized protein L969DRAFT_204079 [Mixia osmundae IAM 14324]|uniref:Pyrimidine 5'-nucleotidase n=1 Tax=Mixia osmundae (strain CBS 9802 / IAM 14324 / JCM 22182 / KY 12970) TaxID=764103 RepID=G7DUP3_MIXOS|nr:uncharacterized protein L969DRAFT_204079 [Mixia osmundae IAM 14324]KEI37482.1 hypothetical protein L969DRAFT_204079 [Mixia osmundae IAM 14324]GAA94303.1 hypothetical protein E5Q_00952 [Mixia osmundae IAM 14324]
MTLHADRSAAPPTRDGSHASHEASSHTNGSPESSRTVNLTRLQPRPEQWQDKAIIWFDIDNCCYSRSAGIDQRMGTLIQAYFEHLGFPKQEATELHHRYYTEYGLAIRGLVRHHKIDPLDYDAKCDRALPLEEILKPDPQLRRLLQDLDRSKVRVWALTNAYHHHATRVLTLLGVIDQFEGVCSCNYAHPTFSCKPEREFYQEAIDYTDQADVSRHYFVDDSALNIRGSKAMGFASSVWFDEHGKGTEKSGDATIRNLQELRTLWHPFFVKA